MSGLEFNPEAGKTAGASGSTPKKVANVANANKNLKGVPLFETMKNGQKITYKDFNGDGQFTDNEIMYIDQYTKNDDGTTSVRRYVDKDGDGYSDKYYDQKYDKDWNKLESKVTYEEDINKVKNRQHLDHEVINRDMRQLETGMMVKSVTPSIANGNTSAASEGKKPDAQFKEAFEQTKLDDRIPTDSSLKRLGFTKEKYMDMNGGVYYSNKAGDSIRISNFDNINAIGTLEDGTYVDFTSKDGKIHTALSYDKHGNPVKGTMTLKGDGGLTTTYYFTYDSDGNQVITDKKESYTN